MTKLLKSSGTLPQFHPRNIYRRFGGTTAVRSVGNYRPTRCNFPRDLNLYLYCSEYLRCDSAVGYIANLLPYKIQ